MHPCIVFKQDLLKVGLYTWGKPSIVANHNNKFWMVFIQCRACPFIADSIAESEVKKGEITRVAFTNEQLHKYFPNSYTPAMMKREILALLKLWKKESWES